MKLPKPENWTAQTTQRVQRHLDSLYRQYEQCSRTDEAGNELSARANHLYFQGQTLQIQTGVAGSF